MPSPAASPSPHNHPSPRHCPHLSAELGLGAPRHLQQLPQPLKLLLAGLGRPIGLCSTLACRPRPLLGCAGCLLGLQGEGWEAGWQGEIESGEASRVKERVGRRAGRGEMECGARPSPQRLSTQESPRPPIAPPPNCTLRASASAASPLAASTSRCCFSISLSPPPLLTPTPPPAPSWPPPLPPPPSPPLPVAAASRSPCLAPSGRPPADAAAG